jgi:oligosaccharide repeat unit polymerase
MIYLSMIAVVTFHFIVFRKRGILDPIAVFLISYLYYSYFTPVTMSLLDQFDLFASETSWISQETIDLSALLSFLGYVGYATGYFLTTMKTEFGRLPAASNLPLRAVLTDTFLRGVLFSIAVMLAVTVLFFGSQLTTSLTSYADKITVNYENSVFSFLRAATLVLMSVSANYMILTARRYALIAGVSAAFFVLLSFLIFSKGPFIFAVLCGFCFLYRYRKLPSFVSLTVMATAGVLALVYFVPAFAVYRATGTFELLSPKDIPLSMIFSDAAGPFSVINYTFSGYFETSRNPLWHSFILWIPKFIWASRPYDVAETFAQQVMKDWQPGFGLGFSPLAEGYARFGMAGVPFFMLLIGATVGALQTFFSSLLPKRIQVPVIMTVGGQLALLVLRGSYSAVITQSLQGWIPTIIICFAASYFARNRIIDHPSTYAGMRPMQAPPPYVKQRQNYRP